MALCHLPPTPPVPAELLRPEGVLYSIRGAAGAPSPPGASPAGTLDGSFLPPHPQLAASHKGSTLLGPSLGTKRPQPLILPPLGLCFPVYNGGGR